MRIAMISKGMNPDPSWILRTDGEDGHISGQLRDRSDDLWHNTDNTIRELCILMEETADQIDDAHEQWMNYQLMWDTGA